MLVSFVLAGVATMVNAICYAEFGARVPKTGALYTYVYESACEFLAFQVAWINIISKYITQYTNTHVVGTFKMKVKKEKHCGAIN